MSKARKSPPPSPLLLPVIFWCLGIVVARHLALPLYPLLGMGFVLLVNAAFLRSIRFALIMVLFALLGFIRHQVAERAPSALQEIVTTRGYIVQPIEFRVLSQHSSAYMSYWIDLEQVADECVAERVLFYPGQRLIPGKRYKAVAEIKPAAHDPILDANYHQTPLRAINQHVITELDGGSTLSIATWRGKLLQRLDDRLGSKAGLAKTILLSDAAEKVNWTEKLSRSGMMHLVVVSGLHVWFIYGLLMLLLNFVIPRRIAELVFIPLILLFAALNMWSPAVSRAILMIVIFIIARRMNRPVAPAQVLALSLFLITLVSPAQLFSAGLQFSYVCVAVILFVMPGLTFWQANRDALPLERSKGRWGEALQRLLLLVQYLTTLSLAVGIAMIPLTLYYFGQASLNGVVGNLMGVPLIALLLPLSSILLIFPAGNALFRWLQISYEFLLMIFDRWAAMASSLPMYLERIYFPASWTLIALAVCIMLFLLIRRQFRWLKYTAVLTILMTAVLLLTALPKREPDARIIVFNTGPGDCIYIRLPGDKHLLVDTGRMLFRYNYDPGSESEWLPDDSWLNRKLPDWFTRNGVKQIDWLILTHLHFDHIGGVEHLASALPIRNLIVTDETVSSGRWAAWQQMDLFRQTNVVTITDTVSIRIANARLKFLHPDREYVTFSENNRSLVFRLDLDRHSYLFTGDIEAEAENYLVRRYPAELAANYLKVPHHGSKSSSTPDFIARVGAGEAWISTSRKNRHGFPHAETIERYQGQGVEVKITADGSIVHDPAWK
ncbi:MAG: DNA internalization-related competence protein ComEC/Rec2 [Candidatus Cloacimonetes bacterium]|nr:DNA internalization-related competence protein ComEC/Rec2 [Candidatus Cloacimonadota bacterium]